MHSKLSVHAEHVLCVCAQHANTKTGGHAFSRCAHSSPCSSTENPYRYAIRVRMLFFQML